MSAIESHRVTGDWRHIVDDGLTDPDDLPDFALPEGHVVFTPVAPQVAYAGEPSVAYTFAPIRSRVYRGTLDPVRLVGRVGQTRVRWLAQVHLRIFEKRVPMPEVEFNLEADLQLTELMEAPA